MEINPLPPEAERRFNKKLMTLYFDLVYNPLYDLTTAQTSPYQRLQRQCLGKLQFEDKDSVLCVGVGTGNELLGILERNSRLHLVGVDTSRRALSRANKKTTKKSKNVALLHMDGQKLDFPDATFDKAVCLHLMGFVADDRKATGEIMRVLKANGQFVITYPSGAGNPKLACEIFRNIRHNLRCGRYQRALSECLAVIGAAIVYAPVSLWVKPRCGFYSRASLEAMLSAFRLSECNIDEDSLYQDFIVFGKK
jgi:ubiquinone/menaquinone biosynthesis C-methylase UbiE